MASGGTGELRTVESDDTTLIVLPPIEPGAWFGSPRWLDRIGAALTAASFLGLSAAAVCFMRLAFRTFWAFVPPKDLLGIFEISAAALALLLGLLIALVAAKYPLFLFRERIELSVGADEVTETYRRGYVRRRRRCAMAAVRRLVVGARQVRPITCARPLGDKPSCVWIEGEGAAAWRISGRYSYQDAWKLAEALASAMAGRAHARPPVVEWHLDGAPPAGAVLDAMDPTALNDDLVEPVNDLVQERRAGRTMEIVWKRSSRSARRAVGAPGMRRVAVSLLALLFVALVILVSFHDLWWVGGLLTLLLLLSLAEGLRTDTFVVAADSLERTSSVGPFRFRRRWPRERIAALRIHPRMGEARRRVLELVYVDGRSSWLGFGAVPTLRYLATLLRRSLGVPADCRGIPLRDPRDPAWHLQDEPTPPKNCRIVLRSSDGVVLIERPAPGLWGLRWAFGVCGAIAAAGIVLLWLILPHIHEGDDRGGIIVISVIALSIGGLGLLAAVHDVFEKYAFRITDDKLELREQGLLRALRREWERKGIAAIGTYVGFGNVVRLFLVGGQEACVGRGGPHHMRYLATLLRRATGLPPAPKTQESAAPPGRSAAL